MELLALPALAICLKALLNLRHQVLETTAESARQWGIAAVFVGCITVILQSTMHANALTSALQYCSVVMFLTPFIAILGARRPGANAWPWFVVLPLVLVLQWPSATQLAAGIAGPAIAVPTPTAIGYVFVLLMGAGNYFGTVNTSAVMAVGLGMLLILGSVSEFESLRSQRIMITGYWLIAFSTVLMPQKFRSHNEPISNPQPGPQQLWLDFRDIFGIVWAKRVMDRVNQFAAREKWDVQLCLDGFQELEVPLHRLPDGDAPKIVEVVPDRAVEVLCWVLKRFVNLRFIQRYVQVDDRIPDEPLSQAAT